MTDDIGILSVDFLVGFTIFLVSFIWIATLIPSLFLGLSAHGIDFDAVAYRTGVILAEDPGATTANATAGSPWEAQPTNRTIARFGLAISKETPNILDENKVNRFFCSTAFSYPEDYRPKVIFGDYPYRFNISLRVANEETVRSVGDIVPDNYGVIRRDVKVRSSSNATINQTTIRNYHYNTTENATYNVFSIEINSSHLHQGNYRFPVVNPLRDISYRINPNWDRIVINITDLNATRQSDDPEPPALPAPSDVNLTGIKFYQTYYGDTNVYQLTGPRYTSYRNFSVYEDGNTTPVVPPVDVRYNLSMIFDPGFFSETDPNGVIFINLTFGTRPGHIPMQFLNNTRTIPFQYDYNMTNVTQPVLRDAVMEVAVW